MTARDTLDALQVFLKEKVADQILLQKEPEEGEESAPTEPNSYVHPLVPIIRLPHQNFNPAGFQVPFLAVCFDSDDDGDDEHTMTLIGRAIKSGAAYHWWKWPEMWRAGAD